MNTAEFCNSVGEMLYRARRQIGLAKLEFASREFTTCTVEFIVQKSSPPIRKEDNIHLGMSLLYILTSKSVHPVNNFSH